jgi:hypothetical protein
VRELIDLSGSDGGKTIGDDQPDHDIAVIERCHRQRARVEDRFRDDEDTGLAKLPFESSSSTTCG